MHGPDSVIEEILDWRPYDYVTDRTIVDTPVVPVRFLHTIEFEPTTDGTIIHYRFAGPDTPEEQELAKDIAPAYGDALRAHMPALVQQLEAEYAVRVADRGPEPRLPSVPANRGNDGHDSSSGAAPAASTRRDARTT